jgi:hypothetical protein
MAIQLAVFAFGGLLMLVAILGGGFEVRELKVPTVGRSSRLVACMCGMLFVVLSLHLDRPATPEPQPAAPQAQNRTETPVAAVPQIIVLSGPAELLETRIDKLADRPVSSPLAASRSEPRQLAASNAAPQPSLASSAETQQKQATASRRARPSPAQREDDGQATVASGETQKRGPVKRVRQWWNRLKDKKAAR